MSARSHGPAPRRRPYIPPACGMVRAAVPLIWTAMAIAPVPASGQMDAGGLTLGDALVVSLERSPDVALNALGVDAREGELQAAAGAFDFRLTTSLNATRELQPTISTAGLADGPPLEQNSSSYLVGVRKAFRSGLVIQPTISVTRSAAGAVLAEPAAAAAVELNVIMPLLRDRFGVVSRAPERALTVLLEADQHAYAYGRSRVAFETAAAYWRYRAAQERLEIQRASEARALRLVEETAVLVEAGERPTADLNHVQGNLSGKRIAALVAEQQLVAARRDLGVAMGIPAPAIQDLSNPATGFPDPGTLAVPDPTVLGRLTTAALAGRADLAGATARAEAGAILAAAARKESRPALDLSLSVGYTGMRTGESFDRFFTSLYSHVPGPNASLALSWEAPLANDRAQGAEIQTRSQYEQAIVAHRDLARRIEADVQVGFEAVRTGARAVAEASQGVRLSGITVENERVKHRLGLATLFDVILAEDALTNVLLAEVAARVDYATAIAGLRFQTGTLLSGDDATVSVERFLTIPE